MLRELARMRCGIFSERLFQAMCSDNKLLLDGHMMPRVQEAVLEGRERRHQHERHETAATVIQRCFQAFRMRRRHHLLIHVIHEVLLSPANSPDKAEIVW
jgi:hypothetical protein